MIIFIHLRHGFNAKAWKQKYFQEKVADLSPYGYHHAEKYGCKVTFSEDKQETRFMSIFRRVLGKVIGFDLIHARRNLKNMENSDVIWTHTEYEFLAILFLLRKLKKKRKPKIICQPIWLADRWNTLPFWKKQLYKWLLKEADILTFHSSENLKFTEKIIPEVPKKQVLFGISLDSFPIQKPKIYDIDENHIKILSLGNDIHRDWKTLINAVGNKSNIQLKILTYKLQKKSIERYKNTEIIKPNNLKTIKKYYKWADIVVIPLKENLHASGITVLLEATTFGKPVICSDTGGLKDYFSDNSVFYVSVGNAFEIYDAILKLSQDKNLRYTMVKNAQKNLIENELTTIGFAKRHCEISQVLLKNEK